MNRNRIAVLASVAVVAAAGLGTGAAIAASGGSTGQPAAVTATPGSTAASPGSSYAYYRSMMGGRYGASMMGGSSYRWMMSAAEYQWMTGGTGAPGWMRGGSLPGAMMSTGTGTDPGKIMGSLWAGAPGPRVSPAEATRLGSQIPADATVNWAANRITFTGPSAASSSWPARPAAPT